MPGWMKWKTGRVGGQGITLPSFLRMAPIRVIAGVNIVRHSLLPGRGFGVRCRVAHHVGKGSHRFGIATVTETTGTADDTFTIAFYRCCHSEPASGVFGRRAR